MKPDFTFKKKKEKRGVYVNLEYIKTLSSNLRIKEV